MTEDRIVRLAPERDAPAALEACLMHAGALLGRPITLAALQVPQAGMGAGLGVRGRWTLPGVRACAPASAAWRWTSWTPRCCPRSC